MLSPQVLTETRSSHFDTNTPAVPPQSPFCLPLGIRSFTSFLAQLFIFSVLNSWTVQNVQ